MLIGELANALGVTTRTLRHYEAIGLVPVADRAGNAYDACEMPAAGHPASAQLATEQSAPLARDESFARHRIVS